MSLRCLVGRIALCLMLAFVSVHVRAEQFGCGGHPPEMASVDHHDMDARHGHGDDGNLPDHKGAGHGNCCFTYACCAGVVADYTLPPRPRIVILHRVEMGGALTADGWQPLSPPPKST